jgi:hypothetical protein
MISFMLVLVFDALLLHNYIAKNYTLTVFKLLIHHQMSFLYFCALILDFGEVIYMYIVLGPEVYWWYT